eukprot:COSAG04_NODE_1173_length_7934_cov_6.964523_1_plen_476_part_00
MIASQSSRNREQRSRKGWEEGWRGGGLGAHGVPHADISHAVARRQQRPCPDHKNRRRDQIQTPISRAFRGHFARFWRRSFACLSPLQMAAGPEKGSREAQPRDGHKTPRRQRKGAALRAPFASKSMEATGISCARKECSSVQLLRGSSSPSPPSSPWGSTAVQGFREFLSGLSRLEFERETWCAKRPPRTARKKWRTCQPKKTGSRSREYSTYLRRRTDGIGVRVRVGQPPVPRQQRAGADNEGLTARMPRHGRHRLRVPLRSGGGAGLAAGPLRSLRCVAGAAARRAGFTAAAGTQAMDKAGSGESSGGLRTETVATTSPVSMATILRPSPQEHATRSSALRTHRLICQRAARPGSGSGGEKRREGSGREEGSARGDGDGPAGVEGLDLAALDEAVLQQRRLPRLRRRPLRAARLRLREQRRLRHRLSRASGSKKLGSPAARVLRPAPARQLGAAVRPGSRARPEGLTAARASV